jgi:ribokinase
LTVLVVGNATVDLSYEVARLPAAGETILARSKLVDAGGKGLNQAIVAHRAGATVIYCAPLGQDPNAAVILERLELEGLATRHVHRIAAPTDESLVFVAEDGENAIVSTAAAAHGLNEATALAAFTPLGPDDLLLMQGNLTRATTAWCLERARRQGMRTMVNPAPTAFDYGPLWPSIDIAVVNEVESEACTGITDTKRAARAVRRMGARTVITTLGSEGANVADGDDERSVPAPRVNAIDTTGAGDVFCGVLAAAIDARLGLVPALEWAVAGASLSVTRRGTASAFPSREELEQLRPAVEDQDARG